MRSLSRNKRLIWWSRQVDTREVLDGEGNRTGVFESVWSPPESERVYVSAARGDAELELFGQQLDYDRVISASPFCPLDEQCAVWVDADPVDDPYDYVVVRSARWKNSALFAIQKVDLEYENPVLPQSPGA